VSQLPVAGYRFPNAARQLATGNRQPL